MFFQFTKGILFAGSYVLTRNLALSIGLHTGYDFFWKNIFSFQAEGAYIFKLGVTTSKSITELSSQQMQTIMTKFKLLSFSSRLIMIVILGLIVILWVKRRYKEINIDFDWAVYKRE